MVLAERMEQSEEDVVVGVAPEIKDRLAEFFVDVASGLVRSEQRRFAEVYARGLIEAGARKSLEPMVARLGGGAVQYEGLQHFLADSPWDPAVVDRAVAERVCAVIEPAAWVLDDTGIPKDGKRSPGVQRQYSGTLGKIGNCQIAVSLHAVSVKGTVPLGFRLYLPRDWAEDPERRRRAKIPADVAFKTKPMLGADLVTRAAGWKVRRAPVLGDQAYGNDGRMRTRLHGDGIDYVLSIGTDVGIFDPDTPFAVPPRKKGSRGPAPAALATDIGPRSVLDLALGLDAEQWHRVSFRDVAGEAITSRFAMVRVIAAGPITNDRQPPREEWLIIEWPDGREHPIDYWISNLPADTEPERLARLARLRWMIELDYKQLKGELGLDHYEGRSWAGFHHHCTLVTAAHGFLTLERADPNHPRPA